MPERSKGGFSRQSSGGHANPPRQSSRGSRQRAPGMPGVQSPPTPFPAHVERLVQVGLGEVERVEHGQPRLDVFASCLRTSRSSAPGHYSPDDPSAPAHLAGVVKRATSDQVDFSRPRAARLPEGGHLDSCTTARAVGLSEEWSRPPSRTGRAPTPASKTHPTAWPQGWLPSPSLRGRRRRLVGCLARRDGTGHRDIDPCPAGGGVAE